jgi:pimeloyl-ACP methyl ester carboxylesterase
MRDDASHIREHLDRIDGPVIVVGHSYGGIPVTEAVAGATNVAWIVYLAAFQLAEGESLVGVIGDQLPTGYTGTLPPPDDPITMFYGDVPVVDAEAAAARLVPQTIRSFNETVTAAAWRTIPSAYVICEKDQAIPVVLQEAMAERAATVRRLPSAHSPFLSMPVDLARLLMELP